MEKKFYKFESADGLGRIILHRRLVRGIQKNESGSKIITIGRCELHPNPLDVTDSYEEIKEILEFNKIDYHEVFDNTIFILDTDID